MNYSAIPCMIIRGGTSKGIYFNATDLPSDRSTRNALIIRLMGSPDPRQIDGIGGAMPITSKVAIISPSPLAGIDIDYEFAQVLVDKPLIDFPTCGNILSGVGLYALLKGLHPLSDGETTVTVRDVNTGGIIRQIIQTPNGRLSWEGETSIEGVPGTSAPVVMYFSNIVGGKTGAMYPSGNGNKRDIIDGITVSLIDVAMPCMYVRASDFGLSGAESKQAIDTNKPLLEKLLAMRLKAGEMMGIEDVAGKVYPKIVLLSAPVSEGNSDGNTRANIRARYLTPYECHPTYAVSGGFSLAAACIDGGNLTEGLYQRESHPNDPDNPNEEDSFKVAIEHPSGILPMEMSMENNDIKTISGKVLRTARPIMQGSLFIP